MFGGYDQETNAPRIISVAHSGHRGAFGLNAKCTCCPCVRRRPARHGGRFIRRHKALLISLSVRVMTLARRRSIPPRPAGLSNDANVHVIHCAFVPVFVGGKFMGADRADPFSGDLAVTGTGRTQMHVIYKMCVNCFDHRYTQSRSRTSGTQVYDRTKRQRVP